MKFKELSKDKYGKLTVIREYRSRYANGRPCRKLECLCDCGKTTHPVKEKVIGGKTKSCGCSQDEMRRNLGKMNMLPIGQSSINQVFEVYKKSAKIRGYEFLLSKDDFIRISTQPCIYCGDLLSNELKRDGANGSFRYTGIDRYDNLIGYTIDNSIPCCKICNRVKTDMTTDFMYKHLSKMIANSHLWQRTA